MNTSNNACPSLHVATAVFSGIWLDYLLRRFGAPPWILLSNWVWCTGTVYSTMATRQQVVVDVLAGLALGVPVAYLSLRRRLDTGIAGQVRETPILTVSDDMNSRRPTDPVRAPHLPLTEYYQTELDRQAYLREIFDNTAADYDRIEAMLAWGTGSRYRRQALVRGGLKAGMKVLDVGVGTGLVAAQAGILVGDPALVTGVDPSAGMLAASKLPKTVVLMEGRAESLPFPDNHFDFLSMGYALRHISDLGVAFAEFQRVLKPGGRLCILEITQAQSRFGRWLLKRYMRGVIPLLTRFVSSRKDTVTIWRYYWDSIEACVPPERVMATLSAARLTQVRRHIELGVFSEYQAIKADPGRSND